MTQPGRSCPLRYRYSPASLRAPPSHVAETVYVVGGLYGNVEALHAILAMRDEEERRGGRVSLVFNGDHNWFNVDEESFREVNDAALAGVSIQGNVEAEIALPTDGGCGCNYPDYVSDALVARSNAIMGRLQEVARGFPRVRAALEALPMTRTIQVGGERIGIVHGDAQSLSGWAFAAERLSLSSTCGAGGEVPHTLTPADTIARCFREAGVRAFACTHTCLPHARDFDIDGERRLIINNGAAGMPNFSGTRYGVITRISASPHVPAASLYGIRIGGARFDALPVPYDQGAWRVRFLANWPPDSPAYASYFDRIVQGPNFRLQDAYGGHVSHCTL